jgi:hypothetical protein
MLRNHEQSFQESGLSCILVLKFLQSRDPQQVTLSLHIREISDIFMVSFGNFDIQR